MDKRPLALPCVRQRLVLLIDTPFFGIAALTHCLGLQEWMNHRNQFAPAKI